MSASGIALHDSGTGRAIVMLHAFPLDASQWDHQVAAWSGRARCLRPDMWGCGSSDAPPGHMRSLDDYAVALLSGLDELGIDVFSVVGLSMGGYVAFSLLRLAPQRIERLVLCSTRASADSATAQKDRLSMADRVLQESSVESLVESNIERLVGPKARREPHITDPIRARIRRCTPAGIAFCQRAMAARPDSTPGLGAIDVQLLVVSGAHDTVIPAADMHAISDAVRGSEHVELDAGHLSNLEVHPEFSATVGGFLFR